MYIPFFTYYLIANLRIEYGNNDKNHNDNKNACMHMSHA